MPRTSQLELALRESQKKRAFSQVLRSNFSFKWLVTHSRYQQWVNWLHYCEGSVQNNCFHFLSPTELPKYHQSISKRSRFSEVFQYFGKTHMFVMNIFILCCGELLDIQTLLGINLHRAPSGINNLLFYLKRYCWIAKPCQDKES